MYKLQINKEIELEEISDIDENILEERNKEVKEIERNVSDISEIMFDLSYLIYDQGESIETIVKNIEESKTNVEEATQSLEKSEIYENKNKKAIKNTVLVVGGISLGSLGFIAGPFIGLATLLTGAVTGTGIAFLTDKFS